MQYTVSQTIVRFFITFFVLTLVAANAKPPHFAENSAVYSDQESTGNNLIDTGLRPWQLELLAQRMAELNQFGQLNSMAGQEYGTFDRALRSGNEIKRQSRYRLCYFNPVSCFRK
uniref:Allatostatin c n=1 Tax=Rhynchophorus ferrugineus TaxID=354439 RepID=A0A5Q0TXE6_RHYFE|nr:allatostatin c precursor [Rhynchophorus ferrugineus]